MAVQQQLSGTIVVIIIAMAVQVCIMLVIVVKRQIMRFALRNRRGPHTHIGQGAPKALRREIDRQLEYVAYIRHEPKPHEQAEGEQSNFRIAALKELRSLEEEIECYNNSYLRPPCGNIRSFLLNCIHGPLLGIDSHSIQLLCDDYEHARHHYEAFDESKYRAFKSRIEEMKAAIHRNKTRRPMQLSSPTQTTALIPASNTKAKVRRKSEDSKTALLVTTNVAKSSTPV